MTTTKIIAKKPEKSPDPQKSKSSFFDAVTPVAPFAPVKDSFFKPTTPPPPAAYTGIADFLGFGDQTLDSPGPSQDNPTQSTDNSTQPTDNTTQPVDNTQPTDNTTQPSDNSTQPTDNTTQPTDNTTQPTDNTTQPTDNSVPSFNDTTSPDQVIPTVGDVSDPAQQGACVLEERIPDTRSGIINGGGEVGERFTVFIRWKDQKPQPGGSQLSRCDCSCGEYRQYVKGYFIINNSGVKEKQNLWGGAVLEENVYHEDGRDKNPVARYGHRDEPLTMDEDYTPDRATGCTYVGRDFPRVQLGSDTDMLFQFKGQTYDKCLNKFGPIHEWEVRYKGPIKR